MQERETLTTCHTGDPALAGVVEMEWWKTRETDALPEGTDAVLYRFQRLTREQRSIVHQAPTTEDRYEWAFMSAIRSVAGGRFGPQGWTRHSRPGVKDLAMDADEAEEVFSPAEMIDVGEWIYKTSILGKGCAPRLRLSPTSQLALDASARRSPSAEPSQE